MKIKTGQFGSGVPDANRRFPEQLLQSRLIQIQWIIAGARLVRVPFPTGRCRQATVPLEPQQKPATYRETLSEGLGRRESGK